MLCLILLDVWLGPGPCGAGAGSWLAWLVCLGMVLVTCLLAAWLLFIVCLVAVWKLFMIVLVVFDYLFGSCLVCVFFFW